MLKTLHKNNQTAIVNTLGGELISYKDDKNIEYIWTGDSKYWTGHAPVLFPNIGVLKDSKTKFNNKEYTLQKHGFARKSEFEIINLNEDTVEFQLKFNEDTLKLYPFKFVLLIKHKLMENGFYTQYTVKNTDSSNIYFCIGGHTGFMCPMENSYNFEDYRIEFNKKEETSVYYTDKNCIIDYELTKNLFNNSNSFDLNYKDFDNDALIMENIKSNKIKIINKFTNKGIEFEINGFKALAFWTPPKLEAPFICIEPWVGLPATKIDTDNFKDKKYCVTLPANEEFTVSYIVRRI